MAVAQEESVSRAAEKLAVSQPTLSMAIKKLEEELHTKLFYSFNRKQNLTDEGLRLKEGAEKLLETYRETIASVTSSSGEAFGQMTLGLSPLFGACFFGDLIPNFCRKYPNIRIHMIEDGAYKINDLIEKGEVDIALTLSTTRTRSFANCHFTTQRNVVLLHKSHPLAVAESLTISDLRNEPFAIFNQNFILNRQIMSACHLAGFRPQIVLLSSQWDFLVEVVSRNQGISILPKPVLDKHPDPNVKCIPLTDSMKYWDVLLAWNKDRYMSKACKLFLRYVQEHLPADDL